jgi:hypothetical protein
MPIKGKYSNYNLLGDGISIDFTIDEFIHRKEEIYSFLNDKKLRSNFDLNNFSGNYDVQCLQHLCRRILQCNRRFRSS